MGAPVVEWLDHTGDMAFRVRATSWPGLLSAATGALGEVLFDPSGTPAEALEARPCEVAGADREDVLVLWLTEALLLFEDQGLVPRAATVQRASRTRARGVLLARRLAVGEAPDRVVKAVTYHDLRVVEGRAARPWEVTVVLDL